MTSEAFTSLADKTLRYLSDRGRLILKESCIAVRSDNRSISVYSPGNKLLPDPFLLKLVNLSFTTYRSDRAVYVYRALCEGYRDINEYESKRSLTVKIDPAQQTPSPNTVRRMTDNLRLFLYRSSRAEELVREPDKYHASVYYRTDTKDFYLALSAKTHEYASYGVDRTELHMQSAHIILGGRAFLTSFHAEDTEQVMLRHEAISNGSDYIPKQKFR